MKKTGSMTRREKKEAKNIKKDKNYEKDTKTKVDIINEKDKKQ